MYSSILPWPKPTWNKQPFRQVKCLIILSYSRMQIIVEYLFYSRLSINHFMYMCSHNPWNDFTKVIPFIIITIL